MTTQTKWLMAFVCVVAAVGTAAAQTSEVKDKPAMYSYVGNWAIPRAQWGEMAKNTAADTKVLEKALASGTLIAYGDDVELVHQTDGMTHDEFWSATSMAGLMNVLELFYQSGAATNPVLTTATKHEDSILVSHYYNWHPGSYKNVYTRVGTYKLKPDAADDSLAVLSKTLLVPFFEKMLASGAIHEYEVDEEQIHTSAPGTFLIVYIAANAEGLDKVDAALRETLKTNPLMGPAFGAVVDFTAHRDFLLRTNATFK
jgi:hypothetical protein